MKTTVLLAALGGLIVTVAGLLGGGSSGAVMIGVVIALVMVGGSYWFSDKLALKSAKAVVITESDAPEFYRMVQSLAQRANMPMPRVAISPAEQPNAFATGRGPNNAVVCATQGLLRSMPADELEGVMAHELMHVRNRDILIGSVAAAVATAISAIAQMAYFAALFGGGRDDEDRPNPIALLLISMLAPISASLIQMAISRSREFEADRSAAELLGSGQSLARALQRIERAASRTPMQVAPAQAQAYIHNPLAEFGQRRTGGVNMSKLFSTHPSTDERIRRLLEI
jgi:heat shock protein HtpX